MHYVGLDVSSKRTSVCILDASGKLIRSTTVDSAPAPIAEALAAYEAIERIGLEAGPTSAWLARELLAAGLPAIVIDAAHAAAALKTGFRNKTDKNDARGIADMMRVNKFRAVHVKSPTAQRTRALLVVRAQLRRQALEARNAIWSLLQAEGLHPPGVSVPRFRELTMETMTDAELAPILSPLVSAAEHLDALLIRIDAEIGRRAKADDVCRRLMTVPGVGPLVAVTFVAGVDDPNRFNRARTVGAHFGLTPRRHQSGEVDWSGRISRAGDASVRRALYQAANVLIHCSKGWCTLKSWAVRLAARRGLGKAKVALARKLAVVMHRMWLSGEPYHAKAAGRPRVCDRPR